MTDLDVFLPKIQPFAPGVADPTAFEWIRQAAIEFCERTRTWRDYDDYLVYRRDASPIKTPVGSVIHEIEEVRFNGEWLEPASPSDLDKWHSGWRMGRATGRPGYFTQMEPNTVAIAPIAAGKVCAWLILKPAPDAMELPDFIAMQHRQVIADGALARILALPNQPYSNPQLAAVHDASFQSALARLSNLGSAGQQRAHVRSKPGMF